MTLLYPSHHIVYISNVYTCNLTNFSFLAILRKIFSFTTLLSHGELGTTEPKPPQILAVLETAPHLEALGVPDCHFWCSVSQYCRLIFFFFFLLTILAYWRCLMIVWQRRTYCTGSSWKLNMRTIGTRRRLRSNPRFLHKMWIGFDIS